MLVRIFLCMSLFFVSSLSAQTLYVGVVGSWFEGKLKKGVFTEFTKETGIQIKSNPLSSGATVNESLKLARKPYDVTMFMPANAVIAKNMGILHPLTVKDVPNIKYVLPELLVKDGSKVYSIGTLAWYISLITHTDVYKEAPKSWSILWDKNHKVGLRYALKNNYLIDITAKTFFANQPNILKNKEGILQVLKKAAEIDKTIDFWFDDGKDFLVALEEKEISLGSNYHDLIVSRAKKGKPFRTTFPKEGAVIEYGSFAILKGSQNLDAAKKFINFMLSKEVQVKVSKALGTATALKPKIVRGSFTEEEFADRTSLIQPLVPDPELMVKFGDFINGKWDEIMNNSREEKTY